METAGDTTAEDAQNARPEWIIGLAASAGGLEALKCVLGALPCDLPAAILLVLHLSPDCISHAAPILAARTPLTVREARDGVRIARSAVYVARPDYHLSIGPQWRVQLSHEPRVQFVRPSADVLFDSMAQEAGPRAVAVVLTGNGHDGANGVRAVHNSRGTVIAQSTESANFPAMPAHAIETGCVDFILPLPAIAPKLVEIVQFNSRTQHSETC